MLKKMLGSLLAVPAVTLAAMLAAAAGSRISDESVRGGDAVPPPPILPPPTRPNCAFNLMMTGVACASSIPGTPCPFTARVAVSTPGGTNTWVGGNPGTQCDSPVFAPECVPITVVDKDFNCNPVASPPVPVTPPAQ